jgi:hypothetical protein
LGDLSHQQDFTFGCVVNAIFKKIMMKLHQGVEIIRRETFGSVPQLAEAVSTAI